MQLKFIALRNFMSLKLHFVQKLLMFVLQLRPARLSVPPHRRRRKGDFRESQYQKAKATWAEWRVRSCRIARRKPHIGKAQGICASAKILQCSELTAPVYFQYQL